MFDTCNNQNLTNKDSNNNLNSQYIKKASSCNQWILQVYTNCQSIIMSLSYNPPKYMKLPHTVFAKCQCMHALVYTHLTEYKENPRQETCLRFPPPGAELAIKMSTVDPLVIWVRQHVEKLATTTRQRGRKDHSLILQIKHDQFPRKRDEQNVPPPLREGKPRRIKRKSRRSRRRSRGSSSGGGAAAGRISLKLKQFT